MREPVCLLLLVLSCTIIVAVQAQNKDCGCPVVYEPVCGSDGKKYPTECFAKCFSGTIASSHATTTHTTQTLYRSQLTSYFVCVCVCVSNQQQHQQHHLYTVNALMITQTFAKRPCPRCLLLLSPLPKQSLCSSNPPTNHSNLQTSHHGAHHRRNPSSNPQTAFHRPAAPKTREARQLQSPRCQAHDPLCLAPNHMQSDQRSPQKRLTFRESSRVACVCVCVCVYYLSTKITKDTTTNHMLGLFQQRSWDARDLRNVFS